ncbi:50S ribosomal protein L32 [Candidatus Uhrbacteria bacterium CG_4_9_14_3_um_filter_36_7]|uniref:Large ribosomal subunit protein bL32 n=1 Tax=Candidatus Uhrbacteria bacterium CG_4_9_14_3_um_filter_36_7 TaxID=1975033 RepID=A0A2M7XHD4_9BACT|nr:MAG: 50S ribosomal protein L32 [Candidatus Uhrbacteria bacterium CG_4_9_14_3_um_filter_36_7]
MGLPGHRRTSSDKRRRAAHFALKPIALQVCQACGLATKPHHICQACGAYGSKKASTKTASQVVPEQTDSEKSLETPSTLEHEDKPSLNTEDLPKTS